MHLENSRIDIKSFLKIYIVLLLAGAVIYFYNIENDLRLFDILKVILPGFAIYTFTPFKWRLPVLFSLNIIALGLLFGLTNSLMILAGVLIFLGISIIPAKWIYKAVLSLFYIFLLILFRVEIFSLAQSTEIVKIVGVLLMFRSILYLYELKYEKEPATLWQRINYFFLIPNLVFFIFPIVDYKTFTRNFYNKPAAATYEKGLKWIFTGIIHLLTYRLMYYYWMPTASEVTDIYSLLQYMFVSYALIVRLSGLFHLSAGFICLFGFDIPETFNNYFLATSFSDLWRRINVYWKDFVMKVFYFPIYFKFKKRNRIAIFTTVCIVFFFNWFLHAYQWFWIRGEFLLKDTDIIFWAILGLLVGINSVLQHKAPRKKKVTSFEFKSALSDSFKMVSIFVAMSILWGFWTSPSIEAWTSFITKIDIPSANDLFNILTLLVLILSIGIVGHFIFYKLFTPKTAPTLNQPNITFVFGILTVLLLLGLPSIHQNIDSSFGIDSSPFRISKLNKNDQDQLFQGYYDDLIASNNFNSKVWEVEERKPQGWGKLMSTGILTIHEDILDKKLMPNKSIEFKLKKFTTNEFGLRDQKYSLIKEEGTLRIALLGGSIEIGSGVADDEVYEHILENNLNQNHVIPGYKKIEILNFAVSGYHMPQHVGMAEQHLRKYNPDILIYTAHSDEIYRAMRRFVKVMKRPKNIKNYPFLQKIAKKTKVNESMNESEAIKALEGYHQELYNWGIDRINNVCISDSIKPIYLFVEAIGDDGLASEVSDLKELVSEKGFYFLDLSNVFEAQIGNEYAIAFYDKHPNAKGHAKIAERLFQLFSEDKELLNFIKNN